MLTKIILSFFFVLFISIESCTDAQKTLMDKCKKDFNSARMPSSKYQTAQQKTDQLWNACKNFYKCSEDVQCKEQHYKNVGESIICFINTVGTSSYARCMNNVIDSDCGKRIGERSDKISKGIETDKNKNCDFMKNEAKMCFEEQNRKTEGCGEKELQDFKNVFDDFAKILNCE
ncbi:unnamed protein product [Caenorhabditis angaria]|uniref:DUF19 domain-containing protein n=1 Tax=Caenorhabditis angaria TaxID=860376 RepID=A0A9P1MW11_9PELO|nr:unnamed protein product [Caenorhabditis angaria]